jgi:hypothetical protein
MPSRLEGMTSTLGEQGQVILRAMADGLLAPGQAAQLLGAVAAQAKIIEVDEHARRLDALEQRLGTAKTNAHR